MQQRSSTSELELQCRRDGTIGTRAFALTDLCVLLVVSLLGLFVAVPVLGNRARPQAQRIKCASNLRQIALAAINYAQLQYPRSRRFPRTTYDPSTAERPKFYTGINSPHPFAKEGPPAAGPEANDVTAALFLILRETDVTSETLICPEGDAERVKITANRSNFSGPQELSYSINNPYPSANALAGGWTAQSHQSPDYPFAADMNPGDSRHGGPAKVAFSSGHGAMMAMAANSPNHWFEGQQVVYADGHAEWHTSVFCGPPLANGSFRDNIYTNTAGMDMGTGLGGTVLGAPQSSFDAVLLPTAVNGPNGAMIAMTRNPGDSPPYQLDSIQLLMILIVFLVVVWIVVWTVKHTGRQKPRA